MLNGIIEIDVHGYHGGIRIREGMRDEFGYGREVEVKALPWRIIRELLNWR